MSDSKRSMSILRIILAIRETSAPYNQFSLPWAGEYDITLCTYFPSDIVPPKTVTVFEGDGSLMGFFRILRVALDTKEYDVIHAHSPHVGLFFFLATLLFNRKFMPFTVITVHDSYLDYKLRNRLMFIPVFATFQRIVCCSQASYTSFPRFYKWLAGNRLDVVQNGLDITRVDRVAANVYRRPVHVSEFTIVAISRLVNIKNPFSVLSAFQQSADQTDHLIYIGDGPLHPSLIRESRSLGLEQQIEFTGLIQREKVFEHLLGADLFISTSRGEGLPVAVLEAMACGCPVLLSDIPPHREIASGKEFIPLVDPDDVAGFAREIKKFRKMLASERITIGQKCRTLVEERFSLTTMHNRYAQIYNQIATNRIPRIPD